MVLRKYFTRCAVSYIEPLPITKLDVSMYTAHQVCIFMSHLFRRHFGLSHSIYVYSSFLMSPSANVGTLKATKKFRSLQQQVHLVLHNGPQPGPATFVIHCLYVLPIFGLYSEGFSHLITSAFQRFLKVVTTLTDLDKAKNLAAQLFVDIVGGFIKHDERIVVKILQVFDIQLTNIEKVRFDSKARNGCCSSSAKDFVEQYVSELVETQSYTTAVDVLEHFSIRQSGQSLLFSMLQNNEFKAAEKWATFMGRPMLCLLVQELMNRNKVKSAYGIVKTNGLQTEFPDVYQKCKERYFDDPYAGFFFFFELKFLCFWYWPMSPLAENCI